MKPILGIDVQNYIEAWSKVLKWVYNLTFKPLWSFVGIKIEKALKAIKMFDFDPNEEPKWKLSNYGHRVFIIAIALSSVQIWWNFNNPFVTVICNSFKEV